MMQAPGMPKLQGDLSLYRLRYLTHLHVTNPSLDIVLQTFSHVSGLGNDRQSKKPVTIVYGGR